MKDNLTGLFWLEDANCLDLSDDGAGQNDTDWAAASIAAAQLADGQCGLTDGSSPGDWRLPTVECPTGTNCLLADATGEFASIFAPSCPAPFLPNTQGLGCWSEGDPFAAVQSSRSYWSSTTLASVPDAVWGANLDGGFLIGHGKTGTLFVWPVRGGQ